MTLIQIDHNPSLRQLSIFGAIWLVFFAIAGAIVLKHTASVPLAMLVWCLATVVPTVGWILPRFMRCVYVGMAYAAFPLGVVVSFLLLAIVYYLVLTPIGVTMRFFGHDPMKRHFDKGAETYWCPREQHKSLSSYFRQF
ncbi:MAG: SxtJ family membrane protein [Thermoguttaceae bacterium]